MFVAPDVFLAADGWEFYTEAPTWDAANAAELTPGGVSPEAAVAHFYASRIRGDAAWADVLPATRSETLTRKLARMDDWTIRTVRLVARKRRSDARFYVKVTVDLTRAGKDIVFRDDVTVEREGDRWVVARPPS